MGENRLVAASLPRLALAVLPAEDSVAAAEAEVEAAAAVASAVADTVDCVVEGSERASDLASEDIEGMAVVDEVSVWIDRLVVASAAVVVGVVGAVVVVAVGETEVEEDRADYLLRLKPALTCRRGPSGGVLGRWRTTGEALV